MRKLALSLIKFYQAIPFFNHDICRFTPTCSQYTYQAIAKYGILKGSFLGTKRIFRCHPFSEGGPDPLT